MRLPLFLTFLLALGLGTSFTPPVFARDAADNTGRKEYSILEDRAQSGFRTVHVRLKRRLSKPQLTRIAKRIKTREKKYAAVTEIAFFLPRMGTDEKAWAQIRYETKQNIVVHGLQREDIDGFVAEVANDSRDVIGAWLVDKPITPGKLTIYRDGKSIFAEKKAAGGQTILDKLKEQWHRRGRIYSIKQRIKGPARTNEDPITSYVVTKNGSLDIRGKKARIATGVRINASSTLTATTASDTQSDVAAAPQEKSVDDAELPFDLPPVVAPPINRSTAKIRPDISTSTRSQTQVKKPPVRATAANGSNQQADLFPPIADEPQPVRRSNKRSRKKRAKKSLSTGEIARRGFGR